MTTTQTPLRALVTEAIKQLEIYRAPNIKTVSCALVEMIKITNGGDLPPYTQVTNIEAGETHVNVSIMWPGGGSASEMSIPNWVIDAPDPMQATLEWHAAKNMKKANEGVDRAEKMLAQAHKFLEHMHAAYAQRAKNAEGKLL